MPSGSVFAGKTTFGSDDSSARMWLTVADFEPPDGETLTLPIMRAPSAAYDQRVIAYARADGGGTLLQLVRTRGATVELWWLSLIRSLGWIGLVREIELAASFELVTGEGGTLLYLLDGARRPVRYTTGVSGLLTVNNASPPRPFVADQVTPSLAMIRASGGPRADLGDVDLGGESLAGVALRGASLSRARLDAAVFDRADLTGAAFDGASLEDTSFRGATLDRASFAGATISATRWNVPSSARGIVLARCSGRGTLFGVPKAPLLLDATGADLSSADLRGAVLDRCDFSDANLTGTLLGDGASAKGSVFDRAQLTGAVGSNSAFGQAHFQRARGAGAVFAGGDLRGAVLDGAQFGTKALLFGLDRAYAAELDRDRYPSSELVAIFTSHGAAITTHSEITVVVPGARWRIAGTTTVYDVVDPGGPGPLDVFDQAGNVAPAVFSGALLDDARAVGADLSGADLSGVRWRGGASSLSNADCTGATFAAAQLIDADASQALLDGASFAEAVLIGVKLGGARIRFVPGARRPSFVSAVVLGAQFDAALVGDAVFADAWVALEDGVPLLRLAATAWDDLLAGRFEPVRAGIAGAGYPLSASTRFTAVHRWLVTNAGSGGERSVTTFTIERPQASRGAYSVYDRTTGAPLFRLDGSLVLPSSGAVPAPVRSAFRAQSYPLGDDSTLARDDLWWAEDPTPPPQRVRFRTLTLTRATGAVNVAGAVTVWFAERDLDDVAFGVTAHLTGNAETVTANGFTRRANELAGLDPFSRMMRRSR